MAEDVNPYAGRSVVPSMLVDVPRLVTAYFTGIPDTANAEQRVLFGTSGHRGTSLANSFNENHILAISQAICDYRTRVGVNGPMFMGIDTHALSAPAFCTSVEVFAANGVELRIDNRSGYTPTPVISHAILQYNRGITRGFADGVVITPSHNPPEDGGYKYNPPNGGPADENVTAEIEKLANCYLVNDVKEVKRIPYERAMRSACIRLHDYVGPFVSDLGNVVDLESIRSSGVKIGIDPLGGAAVQYWQAIIEKYRIDATVVNQLVDPTFRFMAVDWDGKIRMDCSSPYAMAKLIGLKNQFDVAFANDTDADRHGVVTRSNGLMNPNHYLAVASFFLFQNRPAWSANCGIGKTIVSSGMIDRVARKLNRTLTEVPVGFKWFVKGLSEGSLGFAGEESAGASFIRQDGTVWTTDKDGISLGLLAAEITARTNKDPGEIFEALSDDLGVSYYERIDAPATGQQKSILKRLSPDQISANVLAGEPIIEKLTNAPGNGAFFGGLKIISKNGWFAVRPSGTEEVYKIYAESFISKDHLRHIQDDAKEIVTRIFNVNSSY